jgi:hypothetical protein
MQELAKTAIFAGTALAIGIAASVVQPESATPAIFSDQGTAFYPRFTDPQAARTIEVVDYDEATATATPLKVQFQRGKWLITTHYNYPVDIGDRLVKTAASLMDVKKDIVRSDSAQDHAQLGVIDPLDQKVAGLSGRGKRVTLRDAHNDVLADYILGKPAEGKPGYRYIRVPGQKRTYAVKTDADPSARFADWVNAGVLRIPGGSLTKVTVNRYNIDETGRLANVQNQTYTPASPQWKALSSALEGLRIADVRPKSPTLAEDLRSGQLRLELETAVALRQKGYFLSPNGRIYSSEGDLSAETNSGVVYTMRFGDVVSSGGAGDNRYLFVTAGGDEKRAHDLNTRFAEWYYVISGKDFQRLMAK